ncbi:MAG: Glu-tRNA(Gln) amidotransferase subunit GatE [Sulfolobales archaeon]|nr:Glu-tRNA(Gln) amidotransferase subunit GatE [Sulfolobales archaeon]MDW8083503.1 Glu-tRNA(Gln) amidotransferase subunit GatE [Sulfolobales archaeon]
MMEIEYRKLGLKVGLEIHQQLDSKFKLFCSCPTKLAPENVKYREVTRNLWLSKSELGEIDPAALYEIARGRKIVYRIPEGHACLVELDEEPPHDINREALVISLSIAKALNARPVDEVYVMRKIVVDGSNTAGFQRTAIIALGGSIEDEDGAVGIQTIALEEDAARKIAEESDYVVYNLDRLGIPLIEISTAPDIGTPEQALRVAYRIGLIMRLSGKVKRGIGTIRQDLNISIESGERIEVKGVDKLELIPKVITYEVLRQLSLLDIREELRRRRLKPEDISEFYIDVSEVMKDCRSRIIKTSLDRGMKVYALPLPGFKGILGREVCSGRRFGTELSDYAKAWGSVGGLIHSDELPAYGISEKDLESLYKYLGLNGDRDAFILIVSDYERADRAFKAVINRLKYAFIGVPKETRAANPDGTTRYLRPQPGAARMYPETDILPLRVDESILREVEKIAIPRPEDVLRILVEEHGISRELASQLIRDPSLHLYLDLVEELRDITSPQIIASTLIVHMKSLKRDGIEVDRISYIDLVKILSAVGRGEIAKEVIPEAIKVVVSGSSFEDFLESRRVLSVEELEKIVEEAIKSNADLVKSRGFERSIGLIMGKVMSVARGRADGALVNTLVRKKLQEFLTP